MIVLGIDIGGTQIKAGMVDETGAILASRAVDTPNELDAFTDCLKDAIRWLLEATATPEGVGFGCKGIVDPATTMVDILPGSLHFLEGLQLKDLLDFPPEVPVYADNDARVAMAAEIVWGAARGMQNAIMLTLGTAVGGAVLSKGELMRGNTGVAGHLGHITLDPNGPLCTCGNRGCLQTFFSASAIEGEAWSAVHRGCPSVLTRLFREQPQLATCRTIFQAAREGDLVAMEIVGRAIQHLGAGIAGLLHVFDPEVVILGGRIADAGRDLFGPLEAEVWSRSRRLLGREVPIVEQQVADKSGIVGAASLVMAARA
jgi:glucokinase